MSTQATETEERIRTDRDGDVGWIRINRPERLNAFCDDMRDELERALEELEADDRVRCVVVTGVGRAFSTGGDVKAMARLAANEDRDGFEALVRAGMRVVRRIDAMEKPVVAAVNGPAAGAGACLALACDLRIASETSSIGFTFVRVGLHPDWGGTYFLPRIVGPALAAEFIYTGEMISADRAERLGIFNRVVPASELEPAARALAGQVASGPSLAIRRARRAIRSSLDSTLDEMLELEADAQLDAFASDDFHEGVTAFLEKRAPRFGG
ncbi:MAG: enoyl-CoA hydratase/isomerase family protein [Gemmatimonadota bacterium]